MAEVSALVRRSPLFHRAPMDGEGIHVAEQPFLGKFIIRGEPNQAAERLGDKFALALPLEPLTSTTSRDTSFLWLGPDEWMLITSPEEAEERGDRAHRTLSGMHHQVVAVGDYYTIIEITGRNACALLMKLTTLDLHPRNFTAGMVAGSMFGRTQAILWLKTEDKERGPSFRLIVRWSMADYLWCLIANAGRQWGVPTQEPIKGEKLTIG
jgi:heterotetrameric sarcosine oxidase gamma subunit